MAVSRTDDFRDTDTGGGDIMTLVKCAGCNGLFLVERAAKEGDDFYGPMCQYNRSHLLRCEICRSFYFASEPKEDFGLCSLCRKRKTNASEVI